MGQGICWHIKRVQEIPQFEENVHIKKAIQLNQEITAKPNN